MCVLHNSLELFRGCMIRVLLGARPFAMRDRVDPVEFLVFLVLLGPARPFSIHCSHCLWSPDLQVDVLLREPMVLACPRLSLYSQVLHKTIHESQNRRRKNFPKFIEYYRKSAMAVYFPIPPPLGGNGLIHGLIQGDRVDK